MARKTPRARGGAKTPAPVLALHTAIRAGNLAKVKELVEAVEKNVAGVGAGSGAAAAAKTFVNQRHEDIAPLARAMRPGSGDRYSEDIVLYLIEKGANPNEQIDGQYRPLHIAGSAAIVTALLAKGADVNALAPASQSTPLQNIVERDDEMVDIVRALLAGGATVNALDSTGRTALHDAAERGHATIVRLLLAAGADRTIQAGDERTPYEIADDEGHDDVTELLRSPREADQEDPGAPAPGDDEGSEDPGAAGGKRKPKRKTRLTRKTRKLRRTPKKVRSTRRRM
jgi:hypothetical protein